MLGQFLEFTLPTPDIRASFDFYLALGFSEASAGETWPHPYAVVTDGRVCLGLHQDPSAVPTLTFVKPGLLRYIERLEAFGVEFEFGRLGNDVFNEVGWRDPSGQLIRLIEARTFSPAKRPADRWSRCGYFLEIGLPTNDLERSKGYWERFGFVGMDEFDDPLPHVSCTSDFIDLGLYEHSLVPRAMLRFETEDLAATLAALKEIGVEPGSHPPLGLPNSAYAWVIAPEGTPLLLSTPP